MERLAWVNLLKKVKVKSPAYFTYVDRNSQLTNKPEVDGALILPSPLSPSVVRFTYCLKNKQEFIVLSV